MGDVRTRWNPIRAHVKEVPVSIPLLHTLTRRAKKRSDDAFSTSNTVCRASEGDVTPSPNTLPGRSPPHFEISFFSPSFSPTNCHSPGKAVRTEPTGRGRPRRDRSTCPPTSCVYHPYCHRWTMRGGCRQATGLFLPSSDSLQQSPCAYAFFVLFLFLLLLLLSFFFCL